MNRLFAAVGLAAALAAAPAVSLAQSTSHHGGYGGGGYRGGGSGSSSSSSNGGGYREQGSAVRGSGYGYRGGGYGYGRGYGYGYGGYRGYGFYPYFGFGFSAAFFDPWYSGYPFYYGAPWYSDYLGGAPYPPPGEIRDPYGYPGSAVRDRYPPERDRDGAWDRDYGSSYDDQRGSSAACGQWVWNAPANKYDWQAGVCAPVTPGSATAGVDAPPLRVPPVT